MIKPFVIKAFVVHSMCVLAVRQTAKAPIEVVEEAVKFASKTAGKETQILLVESFKIGEIKYPAFFLQLAADKQADFELEDGNYTQSTLKRQDDGSFIWDKQDKPQVIRQGKFLNAAADIILTFAEDAEPVPYVLVIQEIKNDQVIYKATGGAVDPCDVEEDQEVGDLFSAAAKRELQEEAFAGNEMMKTLTLDGAAKLIEFPQKINIDENLNRIPDKEFNSACIVSATVGWRFHVEGGKEAYLAALRARLAVEAGKDKSKALPLILPLSQIKDEIDASKAQLRRAQYFNPKMKF
mgnify:CR=1 FL=1